MTKPFYYRYSEGGIIKEYVDGKVSYRPASIPIRLYGGPVIEVENKLECLEYISSETEDASKLLDLLEKYFLKCPLKDLGAEQNRANAIRYARDKASGEEALLVVIHGLLNGDRLRQDRINRKRKAASRERKKRETWQLIARCEDIRIEHLKGEKVIPKAKQLIRKAICDLKLAESMHLEEETLVNRYYRLPLVIEYREALKNDERLNQAKK